MLEPFDSVSAGAGTATGSLIKTPGPCPRTLAGRTMSTMSEQNGSAPASTDTPAGEAPCTDCATNGEKVLAVLGLAFAILVALMAVDMFTGGRVSGYVTAQRGGGGD